MRKLLQTKIGNDTYLIEELLKGLSILEENEDEEGLSIKMSSHEIFFSADGSGAEIATLLPGGTRSIYVSVNNINQLENLGVEATPQEPTKEETPMKYGLHHSNQDVPVLPESIINMLPEIYRDAPELTQEILDEIVGMGHPGFEGTNGTSVIDAAIDDITGGDTGKKKKKATPAPSDSDPLGDSSAFDDAAGTSVEAPKNSGSKKTKEEREADELAALDALSSKLDELNSSTTPEEEAIAETARQVRVLLADPSLDTEGDKVPVRVAVMQTGSRLQYALKNTVPAKDRTYNATFTGDKTATGASIKESVSAQKNQIIVKENAPSNLRGVLIHMPQGFVADWLSAYNNISVRESIKEVYDRVVVDGVAKRDNYVWAAVTKEAFATTLGMTGLFGLEIIVESSGKIVPAANAIVFRPFIKDNTKAVGGSIVGVRAKNYATDKTAKVAGRQHVALESYATTTLKDMDLALATQLHFGASMNKIEGTTNSRFDQLLPEDATKFDTVDGKVVYKGFTEKNVVRAYYNGPVAKGKEDEGTKVDLKLPNVLPPTEASKAQKPRYHKVALTANNATGKASGGDKAYEPNQHMSQDLLRDLPNLTSTVLSLRKKSTRSVKTKLVAQAVDKKNFLKAVASGNIAV